MRVCACLCESMVVFVCRCVGAYRPSGVLQPPWLEQATRGLQASAATLANFELVSEGTLECFRGGGPLKKNRLNPSPRRNNSLHKGGGSAKHFFGMLSWGGGSKTRLSKRPGKERKLDAFVITEIII